MALPDLTYSPPLDNPTAALLGLVRGLRARVTRQTVRETLLSHPDFPSLLSMSEALTDWRIDNQPLQLNTGEQLRELPLPFVAHLNRNGGWYVLVTDLTGERITYTDSNRGRVTEPLAEFEQQWSGVVLLAETDDQSGEPDYAANHKTERLYELRGPVVLTGALLVLFFIMLSAAHNLTAPGWLLLLTKTAGLVLSGLLVAKQLGSKNALTDRLCRLTGKDNCDDVLNAPAAKLDGWLSWADVGLLYFAGGLLTLLATGNETGTWPLLNGLALLALPYTVFSIHYQARVVKQWCSLCLLVQGVLLIEGAVALTQPLYWPGELYPYATLLTAFLLPALAWAVLKPLIQQRSRSHHEQAELLAFKRDPVLFNALLQQQPKMPPIPDDLHPIILGNPGAEHAITMVTNPFCGPCARTHAELEQLISRNTNIKAAIIFAGNGSDGPATQVAIHALTLAEAGRATDALQNWYAQTEKKYDSWASRYSVDANTPELLAVAKCHSQWCQTAGIIGTPTLYVNGYRMPRRYKLDSLMWLIRKPQITKDDFALTV